MSDSASALRPHGGYRELRSFRAAQAVYDGTVAFCGRFVDQRSRTHDQMVLAARSGCQSIAAGSRAAGATAESELTSAGAARASLDKLLLDYEAFLRQRQLALWSKDHPRALEVRALARGGRNPSSSAARSESTPADPYAPYRTLVEEGDPETAANTLVCLIYQAKYLLDRQVAGREAQLRHTGDADRPTPTARVPALPQPAAPTPADRSERSDRSESSAARTPRSAPPVCPACGQPMILRTARTTSAAGSRFWGCSGYPGCRGTRPGPDEAPRERTSEPPTSPAASPWRYGTPTTAAADPRQCAGRPARSSAA